ncbi:hypothetical protein QQF64_020755 [Cirrhinus molitorella]|uniref:Uncharacterized protein n=1 Tax=Cirrhinus molitorella TaxID=172907 RepID=A0ABR3LBJ7_9TELE
MPERHTAGNLANTLSTAMDHWGLSGKVTACVHENARNMVLANTELFEWDFNPCFAHTFQHATNDGLKLQHKNHVLASASRLVSHFHYTQKQQLQNLAVHKFSSKDGQYLWFYQTEMSDAQTLDLTDDIWGGMEELLPVLHSLKCATTALCGETGVSISMVYP